MLVNKVVNDWDEVTFVPTTLGKVLLAAVIVVLLLVAALIAMKSKKDEAKSKSILTVKQLAFCALSIALATVLSNIKVFHFPTGGSITLLSMLVACLPGYFFGLVPGLITGVAYGFLQMLIDPYILFPAQLVVDYILAFGALGLSGLFAKSKFGLLKGYVAGVLGRYVFAVISGWIFFGMYAWEGWGALPYSLAYNAIYIFAEAVVTVIIIAIPAVRKALSKVKEMANS
ncbi:MAG: energy-coupled thiamine transporter ThiT [Lachnospiraceae bacterium]|nr:energy-coupled thiamine transporter ThiT [Lachnospiraceae bacterium]